MKKRCFSVVFLDKDRRFVIKYARKMIREQKALIRPGFLRRIPEKYRSESLPSFRCFRINIWKRAMGIASRLPGKECERKEEQCLEKKISLLFDFQKFEKNADLQAVIDEVHSRYTARELTDDEAEYVAAAGVPDTAFRKSQPKDEWE